MATDVEISTVNTHCNRFIRAHVNYTDPFRGDTGPGLGILTAFILLMSGSFSISVLRGLIIRFGSPVFVSSGLSQFHLPAIKAKVDIMVLTPIIPVPV